MAKNIKLKKMAKYQKEWVAVKEAERQREDPVVRLERENKKLLADNLRLDTENDNLARDRKSTRLNSVTSRTRMPSSALKKKKQKINKKTKQHVMY